MFKNKLVDEFKVVATNEFPLQAQRTVDGNQLILCKRFAVDWVCARQA